MSQSQQQTGRFGPRCCLRLLLVLLLWQAGVTHAQDRVVLRKPENGIRFMVSGTVEEYTGKKIVIRQQPTGERREYATGDVVDLQFTGNNQHETGRLYFRENRLDEALRQLATARSRETRLWVRREILALEVQAEVRMNRYGIAAAKYRFIVESDPETMHIKHIPLIWMPTQLSADDKNRGQRWLRDELPTARLLGGSFLLDDPERSAVAKSALRALSNGPAGDVRDLARAQLWRQQIATQPVSSKALQQWDGAIRQLRPGLRNGPYYLLGRGHLLRKDYQGAAAAFLWIPLVYDHNQTMTARATLDAADALSSGGRNIQAQTLLEEVIVRFPDSSLADEAAMTLQELYNTK